MKKQRLADHPLAGVVVQPVRQPYQLHPCGKAGIVDVTRTEYREAAVIDVPDHFARIRLKSLLTFHDAVLLGLRRAVFAREMGQYRVPVMRTLQGIEVSPDLLEKAVLRRQGVGGRLPWQGHSGSNSRRKERQH